MKKKTVIGKEMNLVWGNMPRNIENFSSLAI